MKQEGDVGLKSASVEKDIGNPMDLIWVSVLPLCGSQLFDCTPPLPTEDHTADSCVMLFPVLHLCLCSSEPHWRTQSSNNLCVIVALDILCQGAWKADIHPQAAHTPFPLWGSPVEELLAAASCSMCYLICSTWSSQAYFYLSLSLLASLYAMERQVAYGP